METLVTRMNKLILVTNDDGNMGVEPGEEKHTSNLHRMWAEEIEGYQVGDGFLFRRNFLHER